MGDWPDIKTIREEMGLTQQELAVQLGISRRTVQSCEQGWRSLGVALEKCLLLQWMAYRQGEALTRMRCWEVKQCRSEQREHCFTYLTRQGFMCWFLSSSACDCQQFSQWDDKKAHCRQCAFFQQLFRVDNAANEGQNSRTQSQ